MTFKAIENRKARYEYTFIKTIECGVVLKSTEVRSIIDGHGSLQGSFAKIVKGEIFLFDFYIPNTLNASWNKHEERSPKKLLLKKKEIVNLMDEMNHNQKYTLVPLKVYYSDSKKIKVQLGLCYGNNIHDKREYIKERDSKKMIKEF